MTTTTDPTIRRDRVRLGYVVVASFDSLGEDSFRSTTFEDRSAAEAEYLRVAGRMIAGETVRLLGPNPRGVMAGGRPVVFSARGRTAAATARRQIEKAGR